MTDHRIGITGAGDTSWRNATALVSHYLAAHADDRVTFVVDCTTDEEGQLLPGPKAVVAWALDEGYPVEVVMPSGQKPSTPLASILVSAAQEYRVVNVPAAVVRRSDVVLIAWADEDDLSMRALLAADKHTVPAFDLAEGLVPLGFDDAAQPPWDAEDAPEQTAPAAPGRTEEQASAERTDIAEAAPEACPEAEPCGTVGLDLDALAAAIADKVIEAVKALMPVKRGPGRPRKTPVQE